MQVAHAKRLKHNCCVNHIVKIKVSVMFRPKHVNECNSADVVFIHPVSITRFPLRRFSPGAGCSEILLLIGSGYDFPGAGSEKTGIF